MQQVYDSKWATPAVHLVEECNVRLSSTGKLGKIYNKG